MPDITTLQTSLGAAFPEVSIRVEEYCKEVNVHISADQNVEVLKFLRDQQGFNFMADLSGLDALELENVPERFCINYHLLNMETRERLRVKAWVSGDNPRLRTASGLWKTANWQEREVYDLFGIVFEGHPDLRRILMPEEFKGWPLRKDFPLKGRGYRESFTPIPREFPNNALLQIDNG